MDTGICLLYYYVYKNISEKQFALFSWNVTNLLLFALVKFTQKELSFSRTDWYSVSVGHSPKVIIMIESKSMSGRF